MKRSIILTLAGIVIGAIGGWLYWKYFGCQGSCAITSKPLNSSIYGAVLGGLLFNTVLSFFKNPNEQHDKVS